MNIIITIILFSAACVGVILLQIFLSKKESKWLGLILPSIVFIFSIFIVANVTMYTQISYSKIKVEDILNNIQFISSINGLAAVTAFLIANIPTAILLYIFFLCKKKYRGYLALKKMSIQDLG